MNSTHLAILLCTNYNNSHETFYRKTHLYLITEMIFNYRTMTSFWLCRRIFSNLKATITDNAVIGASTVVHVQTLHSF